MLKYNQYTFIAAVWLWPGDALWHFVTLPQDLSEEITARFGDRKRGWGSLPVGVTIGSSVWNTSIFSDKKLGSYILPLKSAIREKESIHVGQKIQVLVEIKV